MPILTTVLTSQSVREIPRLSEVEHPFMSANVLVQSPTTGTTEVVPVTGVKVNSTDKGLDVILEISVKSEQLQVSARTEGNSYVADIPNARLQLQSGDTFQREKPVAGIAEVTATQIDANSIQLTITGETGVPTVELFDSPTEGLVFRVTPTATTQQTAPTSPETTPPTQQQTTPQEKPKPAQEEHSPIELEVSAPPETGYRVSNTSSATKTDTPLRDIPASVQVIPRAVIDDLGAKSQGDVLRTVGIGPALFNSQNFDDPKIRGFRTSLSLRNGIRDVTSSFATDISNTERLEVLRGPASVLYGQIVPGGVVNRVTKQPLQAPYYFAQMRIGSYDFYQPSIDLSGPLNEKRTLLYRLNASYLNTNSFADFLHQERYFVAPAFTLLLGKSTSLTVDGEYQNVQKPNGDAFISGQPAVGTVLFNPNGKIPRSRTQYRRAFK
ncbi:TonB-dependent receptor plug domain-containing protein [Scytonema sp. NUACC26]|uniref:TonB-dependent receptor plug domain-containing protein n=1 Tax=Scytonema sp. NUACC26 TaxID=3140176 RepID=UPI0038B38643